MELCRQFPRRLSPDIVNLEDGFDVRAVGKGMYAEKDLKAYKAFVQIQGSNKQVIRTLALPQPDGATEISGYGTYQAPMYNGIGDKITAMIFGIYADYDKYIIRGIAIYMVWSVVIYIITTIQSLRLLLGQREGFKLKGILSVVFSPILGVFLHAVNPALQQNPPNQHGQIINPIM